MKSTIYGSLAVAAVMFMNTCAISQNDEADRKTLTGKEWRLVKVMDGSSTYDPPADMQGSRLAFTARGWAYHYNTSDKPTSKIRMKVFVLGKGSMLIGNKAEDGYFKYSIEHGATDRLLLIDPTEEDPTTLVYEPSKTLTGDGMPARPYLPPSDPKKFTTLPTETNALVSELNRELYKADKQLRIYDNGTKHVITSSSIATGSNGLRYISSRKAKTEDSYTYDFMPQHIDSITEVKMSEDSPVGVLRIKLNGPYNYYTRSSPGSTTSAGYSDNIQVNFLQFDLKSGKRIKEILLTLKKLYSEEKEERMDRLAWMIDQQSKFRVSQNGVSTTYEAIYGWASGNKMMVYYGSKSISMSATSSGVYITEIPINNEFEVSGDPDQRRPNLYMAHNMKRGFATYKRNSSGDYEYSGTVNSVPLFINADKKNEKWLADNMLREFYEVLTGQQLYIHGIMPYGN